ncbi:DUF5753 domain-containing protein [Nocardia goodfellowii]
MSQISKYVSSPEGLASAQTRLAEVEKTTTTLRIHNPDIVAGLLQTQGYAEAIFSAAIARGEFDEDTAAVVAARLARQRVLDDRAKRFRILIGEAALLRTVGSAEVMAGQIQSLMATLAARDTVEIGIVPVNALFVSPAGNFVVRDDTEVDIETVIGTATSIESVDIARAIRTFDAISEVAAYGQAARTVLARALDRHTSTPLTP